MPDHVRFTETMHGWLSRRADLSHEDAERAGHDIAKTEATRGLFVLTVLCPDVDALVVDPNHRSPAFGLVLLPALSPRPLRVSAGHLDLFVDTELGARVLHMRYGLQLTAEDGARYFLRGIKEIVRRRWWPTVAIDTTTLFTDVFAGDTADGAPLLRGILRMGPGGVTAQGLSFRGEGGWLGLRGIYRYMRYYVRRVAHVYLGARTAPLRPTWAARP
jgi:cholesterol oxidase